MNQMHNSKELKNIFNTISNAGGTPYIVGGYTRDMLLDEIQSAQPTQSKDIDIEVFNLTYNELLDVLEPFNITECGKSFGVIKLKLNDLDIDISLPRTEMSTGPKHTDFLVRVNPYISREEASKRRDFTINTVMINALTDEIFCSTSGKQDIKYNILEVVSDNSFIDDELRVLRAFQFISRFNLVPSSKLIDLGKSKLVTLEHISKERLWTEWEKWGLSEHPNKGLHFLHEINKLPPEIEALTNTPQSPKWHPEGNVFIHTAQVVKAAAFYAKENNFSKRDTLILVFAGLCHDLGKPEFTVITDGKISSSGHEHGGELPTKSFLESISAPLWLIENVIPLVKEHLFHGNFRDSDPKAKHVRKLSVKLVPSNIVMWYHLCNADMSGRSTTLEMKKVKLPDIWLKLAEQEQVQNNKPEPIIKGKHLIELGMKPSKEFGNILEEYYNEQLEGNLNNINAIIEKLKKG